MFYAKYNASGNDFVIFHSFNKHNRSALAQVLCDRNNGIGADGLIVLLPHRSLDFQWEFYNNDGSTASMCGNGTRAAAHYAFNHGLADANLSFLTEAGIISCQVQGDIVQSQMLDAKILDRNIVIDDQKLWLIDTGVRHLIQLTNNIENFDLKYCRKLRQQYDANVNIVQLQNQETQDQKALVRTYERGVENETLACGTGMTASFVYLLEQGLIKTKQLIVEPRSGEQLVLSQKDNKLFFQGAVKHCFSTFYKI